MSKKKKVLNAEDADLWRRVTENITQLDSNTARRPQLRRTAFPLFNTKNQDPGFNYGNRPSFHQLPSGGGAETPFFHRPESFTLKDADHNWQQRLRRGKVKPEGKVDLHGMSQDRAHDVLSRYISEAQRRGKRFILIITGKGGRGDLAQKSHSDYERGRGVLKTNVPRWLSQGELSRRIVSYYTANREHGGDGALYVVLKRYKG